MAVIVSPVTGGERPESLAQLPSVMSIRMTAWSRKPVLAKCRRMTAASLELPLGSPDPRAVHGRDAMLVAGGFMAARCDRQVQGDMIESARIRSRPIAAGRPQSKQTFATSPLRSLTRALAGAFTSGGNACRRFNGSLMSCATSRDCR